MPARPCWYQGACEHGDGRIDIETLWDIEVETVEAMLLASHCDVGLRRRVWRIDYPQAILELIALHTQIANA